ncbi:VG15 protein, partial [Gordonibacter sp.]|uniref:VG15 protein n=1 Tax=Gordonibacter sp. TaxID=1968902 RepID=UPI002FCC3244
MEIPRKTLDQLTEEINAFSAAGKQMVLNALTNAEWGDVSELRAIMVDVMEAVCGDMTDLAAARSAEFYDSVRTSAVGARLGAIADSAREPKATEGAVRALIQSVESTGSTDQFARELAGRVDYEIKRAAGECTALNAARDPLKPRCARVPSGAETCKFCVMLASRGFVYLPKEHGGGSPHYHTSCDCRIVPGFYGMDVEGYDTADLFQQYLDNLDAGFSPNTKSGKTRERRAKTWGSTKFESYGAFADYASSAKDVEDLQRRCEIITDEWKKTTLSEQYWSRLRYV